MAVEIAAYPTAGVDRPPQGRHERRILPLHHDKRHHHRVMFRAVADDDVVASRVASAATTRNATLAPLTASGAGTFPSTAITSPLPCPGLA